MEKTPLLVLVGAGSNPGLLTSDLTDELLAWGDLRDPTGRPDTIGYFSNDPEHDERQPFFQWLRDNLPRASARPLDFEALIHVLQLAQSQLGTGRYPGASEDGYPDTYASDLFVPTPFATELSRQFVKGIAESACEYILSTVMKRTRSIGPLDSSLLLERLRETVATPLRVFSLNYDTAVTDAVDADWWTGYGGPFDDPQTFMPAPNYPEDRHLNLQMHGSIHFAKRSDKDAFDRTTRFLRFKNAEDASQRWSQRGMSVLDRMADDHVLMDVPMITGFRKPDALSDEPFASYFYHFREAALTTPRWLLLGYGSRDAHVNAVLRSAASFWGDKLRVAICNWISDFDADIHGHQYPPTEPPRYTLSREQQGVDGIVRRLLSPFQGDHTKPWDPFRISRLDRTRGEFGRVIVMATGEYMANYDNIREWLFS